MRVGRIQRVTGASAALLTALLVGAPLVGLAQAVDDPVRNIDALTLQWTDLEHQRDLLEANWRTDRPVLEQQLSLLEREARELTDFLETSARQQDEVEQRRLELLEEQTRLEQEQSALERTLSRSALTLRSLHRQLPPPLLGGWAEELPRLDNPLLTATEKMQLVLDLLGQLDDFAQKVTLHESVMMLDDGRNYLVKQVYLGLSHGWYVTADGRFAAQGIASPGGWQWTAMDDGRPVTAVVGILERRLEPALVSVPLKLNASAPPGGN